MEVEDPISAKFRTVVEALMLKTTSEIVKAFVDVLSETRMEVSRSWMEIDDLKKELEQREKQQAEPNFRSQMTQVTFKIEEYEMDVSPQSSMIFESTESKGEVQISEDTMVEKMGTRPDSVSVPEQSTSERPETETQMSHLEHRSKSDCTFPSQNVPEHQTSASETQGLSSLSVKAVSVVRPQQPLSSTGIIILSKRSQENGAVVSKKKCMQKKSSSTESNSLTHTLRDRHLLSSHKPCLCCGSGFRYSTSAQQSESKKNSLEASCVYTCIHCGTTFQERTEFKSHQCCSKPKCTRCGQIFSSQRTLNIHNRHASPAQKKPFPYKCYLCDHMFATRCGWNIHKRIHVHGHVSEIAQPNLPSPSHSFTVPKGLKAKVEVRLERISDAQLEAALFPKGSFLLNDANRLRSVSQSKNVPSVVEPTPQTLSSYKSSAGTTMSAPMLIKDSVLNGRTELMECQSSSSGTESSESVRQSDDKTEDSGFPTASSQKTAAEKWTKSLIAHRVDSVECDEGSSSAGEDVPKGLNSLSRKRKMSDCSHDMYNGVFPVEKILRWRNTKGRNEVRIKWMPCSLCGAKWKNTWEPAESFITYKDGKGEETDKWN